MIHGPQMLELAAVLDAERRSDARRTFDKSVPGPMRRAVGRGLIGLGQRVDGSRPRRGVAAGGHAA